jgi:hypothetical protein
MPQKQQVETGLFRAQRLRACGGGNRLNELLIVARVLGVAQRRRAVNQYSG